MLIGHCANPHDYLSLENAGFIETVLAFKSYGVYIDSEFRCIRVSTQFALKLIQGYSHWNILNDLMLKVKTCWYFIKQLLTQLLNIVSLSGLVTSLLNRETNWIDSIARFFTIFDFLYVMHTNNFVALMALKLYSTAVSICV